jgi:thiamine biosynthesis lipoprotein
MGTVCHVAVLDAPEGFVHVAEQEVRRLEHAWSRFRADSEISRLNDAAGSWVEVGAETSELLRRATGAWEDLGGWFDPFMAGELVAAGYDRDLHLLHRPDPGSRRPVGRRTPGGVPARCPARKSRSPLELDGHRARLHDGATFDPGGLGKGLAADMVSGLLLEMGAEGALVNLGGDLRARGRTPPRGWRIAVEDPFDRSRPSVAVIGVTDSGLCTSTCLKRRWTAPDGSPAHHVLDPRTGAPADVEIASITVTADQTWRAEALATAVMLAGPGEGTTMLQSHPATALVVHLDGRLQRL